MGEEIPMEVEEPNDPDGCGVGKIIHLVLNNTTANTLTKGKNAGGKSKAKFTTDEAALSEAIQRIESLLENFDLYPELDMDFLKRI